MTLQENERIERIRTMEEAFDAASAAIRALSDALDGYDAAREALDRLTEYYESPLWREDFEADERGKLPADLKRGVLSEDGIYILLEENGELLEMMMDVLGDAQEE